MERQQRKWSPALVPAGWLGEQTKPQPQYRRNRVASPRCRSGGWSSQALRSMWGLLGQWEHQKAKPFRHSLHLVATPGSRDMRGGILELSNPLRPQIKAQPWRLGRSCPSGWMGDATNRHSQSGMCVVSTEWPRSVGLNELGLERTRWSGLLPSLFLGDCCEGWGLQIEADRISHCLANMLFGA